MLNIQKGNAWRNQKDDEGGGIVSPSLIDGSERDLMEGASGTKALIKPNF